MPRWAPAAVSLLSLLRKAAYKARRRTATKKISHGTCLRCRCQGRQAGRRADASVLAPDAWCDRRRLRRYRHQPDLRLSRSSGCRNRRSRWSRTDTVLGILSLIVWSLFLLVTLKYVFVLLRADFNGEGGTFALMALAQSVAQRSKHAHPAARHCRRILPLRRRRHHASALRHIGRRGPQGHRPRLREGGGAAVDRHSDRPVCHAKPRNGQGGGAVRPDHPAVVRRPGGHRRRLHRPGAARARRLQSDLRRNVSPAQWPDRVHRAGPRVPRRHWCRGALRRSRSLRSQADPGSPGWAWRCPHSPSTTWDRAHSCSATRRRSRIRSS